MKNNGKSYYNFRSILIINKKNMMITSKFAEYGETINTNRLTSVLNCKIKWNRSNTPLKTIMHMILKEIEKTKWQYEAAIVGSYAKCVALSNKKKVCFSRLTNLYDDIDISICIKTEGDSNAILFRVAKIIQKIWGKHNTHLKNPLFFSPDHSLLSFSLPFDGESIPIQLSVHALTNLDQPTFLSNETSFTIPIKFFKNGIGSLDVDKYVIYSKAGPYPQVLKDVENGRISSDVAPFVHGRAWFRILKAITLDDFAFLPPENNRDLFKKDALAKKMIVQNMNFCAKEKKMQEMDLVFYAFNALFACLSAEQMLPIDHEKLSDLFIENIFLQFSFLKEDFSWIFPLLNQLQQSNDPKIKIALFKKLLPLHSNKNELKIHLGEVQIQCSFKVYGKIYYVLVPLLNEEEVKLIEETHFSQQINPYFSKISEIKNECLKGILKLSGNEVDVRNVWTAEEIKTLLAVYQKENLFYLSEILISILQIYSQDVKKMHQILSSIRSFCPEELWENPIAIQSRFVSMHSSMQIEEFSLKILFEIYDAILNKKPIFLCNLLKKISGDHPSIPEYLALLLINLSEDLKKRKMMEKIESSFPFLWKSLLQKIKGQLIEYEMIVFLSERVNHGAKRDCYLQLIDLIEKKWESLPEILPSLLIAATDVDKMRFMQRCLELLEKIPSLKELIIFHLEALKNRESFFRNIRDFSFVERLYNLLLRDEKIELALDLLDIFPHLKSLLNPSFCNLIKQESKNQFLYIQYLEKLFRQVNSNSLSPILVETYVEFAETSEIADFLEKNFFLIDSVHAEIQQFHDPIVISKLLKRINRHISDKKPIVVCRLLRYLPKQSSEIQKQIRQLLLESAKNESKNKIAQTAVCHYFPKEWPLILEANVHPIHVIESIVSIIQNSSRESRKASFLNVEDKLYDYATEIEPILAELLLDITDLEKWNCVKKRLTLPENHSSQVVGKQFMQSISNPTSLFQEMKFSSSLLSSTCDFFIEQELMSKDIADVFYMQMKNETAQEKLKILSKIFPYLSQEVAEQVIEEQQNLLTNFSTGCLVPAFFVKIKSSLSEKFPQLIESIRSKYFSFFITHLSSYVEHRHSNDCELLFQEALECFNCPLMEKNQKHALLTQCLAFKDHPPLIVAFFSDLIANVPDFDLLRDFSVEEIKTGFQILQKREKAAPYQRKPKEISERYLTLCIENSNSFCLEFIKQNYWNYFNQKIKNALILKFGNMNYCISIEDESDRIIFIRIFLRLVCDPKMKNDFFKNLEFQKIFNKVALYCLSRKGDVSNPKKGISVSIIKKIIHMSVILFNKKIADHHDFALFASFLHNSDIVSDEEFKHIAQAISFDYLKEKFKEHQRYSLNQKQLWFRVLEFKYRTIKTENLESVDNWLSLLQILPHNQMILTPTLSPTQFVDFYPISFSMACHPISYSKEIVEKMIDHMISLRNHSTANLSLCCASLMRILPSSEEGKNMRHILIREVQLYRLNRDFRIDSDLSMYLQFLTELSIEEGKTIEDHLKTHHLWFTNQTFGKLIQLYDRDTPFGHSMKSIGEDLNIVGAIGDIIAGRDPEYSLTSKTATKGLYWLLLHMWPESVNLNSILNFLHYIKHRDPQLLQNLLNDFQVPEGKDYSHILEDFKTLILTYIK